MWRSTWPASRRVATRSRRRSRACGAASSPRSAIRPSCARAATPSTRSGPRWGRRRWPRPEGGVIPKHSQFARDSFGIFAAQIAVMALGIGTSVITARALGPSGRGLLQLLTIFPATMSNFAKLGIPMANVYCIRRRGARTSAVASNSLLLGLALGTALALVCWLGRGWLLHTLLRGVPAVTLPLVLVLLPFVVLQTFFLGILQALSYSLAALMLLVVFVRESGHSVAETVLVGREEIGGYVRRARGLVPGAAAE